MKRDNPASANVMV
ncbi:hypothetical protein Tsp_01528, partial [Trichinella spiralis]